jgi:hypothetical protein
MAPPPSWSSLLAHHPRERAAGIALVSVGGAALILGATFMGVAAAADGTIANPPPGWIYDAGLDNRRALFPAGVTVGVVGAGALVAGALLLVKRR